MGTWRIRFPVVALALVFALTLSGPVFAAPTGQVGPQLPPLFDPQGPDGQPGAWIWQGQDDHWLFIPARAWEGDQLADVQADLPWPQDPATFWVAPASQSGEYWVWDVFYFALDDEGPSFWVPRWRLVSGISPLGQ